MSHNKRRLDRLECSLNSRQAVLLWLQEIHQYPSLLEYARSLLDRPETGVRLLQLRDQVERAIQEAMKGRPRGEVEQAVRQAVLDILFLYYLHSHVNQRAALNQPVWDLKLAVLAEQRSGMLREQDALRNRRLLAMQLSLEIPYPLDRDTAASVEAAIRHHVTTWQQLEEEIEGWVLEHLIQQGATELPERSYGYRNGKFDPAVDKVNQEAIRASFQDEARFEKFKAGQDYSYGLSDVTDEVFNQHYHRMVSALQQLIDSGEVQAGATVHLDTVPMPFLQDAPLLEGVWMDGHVVELAEWGALLRAKGYVGADSFDEHPLAWQRFARVDTAESDQDEVKELRRQAARRLVKFPGRTRDIDGRAYLHFEDYCRWRGRKVKGVLRAAVQRGFVTASWNAWLDANGGDGVATQAGVPVGRLEVWAEGCPYQTPVDEADDYVRRRERLLDSLINRDSGGKQAERVRQWQDWVAQLLAELYLFRQAVASICRRYFDGQEILFPETAEQLGQVVDGLEEMVAMFNQEFADQSEQQGRVDLEAVRERVGEDGAQFRAILVDMARASTLVAAREGRAAGAPLECYL